VSTPTSNYVATSTFVASLLGDISALLDLNAGFGTKWGGAYGTGISLTFSFPTGTASFESQYGYYANTAQDGHSGDGEFYKWWSLNTAERNAVRSALAQWSSIANVGFTEVADNSTTVGDLRFAYTTIGSGSEEAHAYNPSSNPDGGDVWLQHGIWDTDGNVAPGTYSYLTLIHEIGHALGFKHPFEAPYILASQYDNYSYTVMSYSAYTGGDNYASFYPTTPMYFDIEAMQALYGRGSHNPGNTTYVFYSGQHYWQTIDDSGGVNKIVYVGNGAGLIDLNIGHWSNLGLPIHFDNGTLQRNTVMIGPNTLIENATGGSGNDRIIGNDLNNRLDGGAGKNVLTGGAGSDHFVFDTALGSTFDRITDFSPGVDAVSLSRHIFLGVNAAGHFLAPGKFHVGPHFTTGTQRIDYNPANGWLLYDPHGNHGPATHFMTVGANLDMHNTDFFVIA
jgi:serralysin